MHNNLAIYGRDCTYLSERSKEISQTNEYDEIRDVFKSFILQQGYPCVGAKASVNSKSFVIGIFDKMDAWRTEKELGYALLEYIKETKRRSSSFMSYIAIFKYDHFDTEVEFENSLWNLLTLLNKVDEANWNSGVSNNPKDPNFSYSYGGESFYIVGMHPKSSRKSRQFPYAAMAFNLHSQFERLKEKDRYAIMQNVTRQNDIKFSGSINPMLSDFGEGLEAPQYSGRKVQEDWKCPFNNN